MGGSNRTRTAACMLALAACSVICTKAALADVAFDITALGLTSAGHVRADGYCASGWSAYNDKGGVIGVTTRWAGNTYVGGSAWFYENKVTTRIGLWDAAHTDSDGYAYSRPISMTDRNEVLGVSTQYAGQYQGQTAWLFSKGITKAIGPINGYVGSDGTRSDSDLKQNASGQVTGASRQYQGTTGVGSSAWIYHDGTTSLIGRTGGDALSATGHTANYPEYISDGGYVAGWGGRYSPDGSFLGMSAWRYGGGQTVDIGLFDSEHTASGGNRESRTQGVNSSGDVIGYSSRYGGTNPMGRTAWIDHGGSTTPLGLTSGIHTASDGTRVSEPTWINSPGQAAGWSTQYVNGAQGCSTWFYNGTTTRQIGLVDPLHIKADGTGYNIVVALNDAGDVAGVVQQNRTRTVQIWDPDSMEVSSAQENGLSSFHYKDGATTRIGLLDSKHVGADGWSANTVTLMNTAGQIAGVATRTNGRSGATAWFYDPAASATFPLEFSETSSGLASSVVQFLSDDGVCLGTYSLFGGDVYEGDHAFYWSLDKGFHDLGSLDAGSFGAQGWQRLYDRIIINGNGDVIATGALGGGAQGNSLMAITSEQGVLDQTGIWGNVPVMLTVVPEPSSMACLVGLGSLLGLRFRRIR